MGLSKALHPVEFLKLVRQYDVVHQPLPLNLIASTLPWLEIFCGVLLLLGVAVRGAALVVVLMLVPFTILVLLRALHLQELNHLPFCAIKFDCGCGAGEVFICRKLAENVLLTAVSIGLIVRRENRLCLWPTLVKPVKADPSELAIGAEKA
jgi:uncharacterized membrane protein YphA (DoxX/SURF4 family)